MITRTKACCFTSFCADDLLNYSAAALLALCLRRTPLLTVHAWGNTCSVRKCYLTILLHVQPSTLPALSVVYCLVNQLKGTPTRLAPSLRAAPLFHLSMLLAPCVETALLQVGVSGAQLRQFETC